MRLLFRRQEATISTPSGCFGPFQTPNGPLSDSGYLEDVYNFMWQCGAPFDLIGLAQSVATSHPHFREHGWGFYSSLSIDAEPSGTLVFIECGDLEDTIVYQWLTYGPSPAFGEPGELISTVGNTFVSEPEDDEKDGKVKDILSYLGNFPLA